jgi:hypothetical protein
MQQVHGKRSLHFGATETWKRAKSDFPRATISLEAVRQFVKECAMCQKMRDTGVRGLPEQILSLKPETYRKTVGIDHVTVTPADQYGNTCVVLIVEHFSHFPQAYAAKEYSGETAARVLFRHFMTFGVFDELASDPGSSFMSEVVSQLNQWLGVRHKVSLVERHESNGCEGSGKQFIRHLKTFVSDERMTHRWSDDTILPLINFEMASFPTKETGGLTPFQLKYGTQDAKYFMLPEPLEPGAKCHELLKRLDEDVRTVREVSKNLQEALAAERAAESELVPRYEAGDFVLWNPKETPCSHLETKLAPTWMGPYEVVEQVKNDVECVHINLRTCNKFHVSRLKPFFGSREEALEVAKLDRNQFFIVAFNYFYGNPHKRTSLVFNVTFEDETKDVEYNRDLASSSQFDEYVKREKFLFPLRYGTVKQAKTAMAAVNKRPIENCEPGDMVFLNLRYFDAMDRMWFDSLKLPEKQKVYVFEARLIQWSSPARLHVVLVPVLTQRRITLGTYDFQSCVHLRGELDAESFKIVDDQFAAAFPRLVNELMPLADG